MPDHRPGNAGMADAAADTNGAVAAVSSKVPEVTFGFWLIKVLATTLGETGGDAVSMSLNLGYAVSSIIFIGIFVVAVASPKVEMFYWVAILFSQTLGTALGDWMADTNGLGYEGGALVFAAGLAVIAGAYFYTNVSHTLLFWSAFILTRPLGATLGDLLDKPIADGGLN